MTRSLFSSSWHSVADLRPRLAAQARIERHVYRGQVWHVVQDQSGGRYHRLSPAAYALVRAMDGSRTVQALWEQANATGTGDACTQNDIVDLLVQLHGAVFTAWLLVFVAQTRLVAARRVDLHVKLGIAAVVIAVLVLVIGFITVAVKANEPRIHPSGLTPPQFTIVGMASLALFALFVGLGIALRKRPDVHKRLMVLAMISVLIASINIVGGFLVTRRMLAMFQKS